jgi:hypothetical protein
MKSEFDCYATVFIQLNYLNASNMLPVMDFFLKKEKDGKQTKFATSFFGEVGKLWH